MANKKRMYKKGSFLEPNKALTFGSMKKGKYEAAGPVARQMENAKKAKAAADRIEAEEASKAAAAQRGPSRQAKQNTPQGTGGGAKPQVGSKLKELSNAPGPTSTGPKPGTYAYAKKRNPNLDKLIAERKKYAKGSDDYNRVQNQINKAYNKGPMRNENQSVSKPKPRPAAKNTIKPTLKVKTPAKPAAKPAAKKPTPTKTPSGGSGMGAVAKENAIKKELQSAKPADRRTSAPATKSTSKKMDRLVKKVKKEDARLRRKLEKDLKSRGMMMGGMKYGIGGKYMNKGGFPDLNGDGKVTFADVLKGRLKGKKRNRK